MVLCFICDSSLESGTHVTKVTREQAIASLKEASTKRKDGKLSFLKNKTELEVHETCRKSYTNEKLILASLKRAQQEGPSTSRHLTRTSVPQFTFKTHCFICGECITEEFVADQSRRPKNERNTIFVVGKLGMKTTLMNAARERNDEYGRRLIQRIEQVEDLVAADGQYHSKCLRFLYQKPKVEEPKRRGPFSEEIERSMQCIYDFIENNNGECQFSLDDLMKQMKQPGSDDSRYTPDVKTVKARLKEKYGDDILLTCFKNRKPVVCFRNIGEKILTNAWYEEKCKSEQDERLRVVLSAAKILCEDIRSKVYENTEYPPPDRFLEESESVIPETLRLFLETLMSHRKKNENWKTKCTAVAHSIISVMRPKSFVSSVQVGLAAFIYKKTGSRKLLEVLNSMGFCCTYKEAVRFEYSSAMQAPKVIDHEGFTQFIFDNADFNTQTLDGYNTFHVMGGMYAVSPATAVPADDIIPRLKERPSTATVGSFGEVMLQHFEPSENGDGLKGIKIRDLNDNFPVTEDITFRSAEILWLYSKWFIT